MYINLKRDKILSRIRNPDQWHVSKWKPIKNILDDRRFKPSLPRIPGNCILISIFRIGKDRLIPVRRSRNKSWNEKERERERDVHEKGLVGEQEVYKSFCRPIRSRKTFRDLRPTNETVPLKFFHACTMRTTPRFIVRDYSRVVKWKWRTIEGRGRGENDHDWMRIFFFFFFWSFMISLFLRRYRLFEIFREF